MKEMILLKAIQERDNLRIEDMAREIGVSVPTIHNWVQGRVSRAHRLTLRSLRAYLRRHETREGA